MTTTLSASRVVDGDPPMVLLLISGPAAANFLPDAEINEVSPGRVVGSIGLEDGSRRTLDVLSSPPRRTPVAYLSEFRVQVEGMPPATGALQVTSAGPAQSSVVFSLRAADEIPDEYNRTFEHVAKSFFDGLQRAAYEQTHAA